MKQLKIRRKMNAYKLFYLSLSQLTLQINCLKNRSFLFYWKDFVTHTNYIRLLVIFLFTLSLYIKRRSVCVFRK